MPMRSCLACRETLAKQGMLRLVVDGEGLIWPDLLQKAPGRGSYLCMRENCLTLMGDKRLQQLRARFSSVSLPQWKALQQRIEHGLNQQLGRMFSLVRPRAAAGRDAVMHRLWNNAPLVLLLAQDAGDAIVRQIDDAVEKRKEAGHASRLVSVTSRSWLGEMLARKSVAIACLDASGREAAIATKLEQYCVWYGRIKVSG